MLRYLHALLAATFVAIVVADLSECQPFSHYWQVIPDPGPRCRQGYAQLLTMGVTNIVTDSALAIFPILTVINSRLPFKGYVCALLPQRIY
jgi:hypothetical protein